jgi:hypothetical protein
MTCSAWMLSLLARQQMFLKEQFSSRYPSSWLVWEPGEWKPARNAAEGNTSQTQHTTPTSSRRPASGDALCFELKGSKELAIGRDSASDIVINDMTISREALRLRPVEGGWRVRMAEGASADTRFGEKPAQPGMEVKLEPGTVISSGGVRFTFYDPNAFVERLKKSAPRGTGTH